MDHNLKHYKLGKRIAYLKHIQSKLSAQASGNSKNFVEYIGKQLKEIDEKWISGKEKDDIFYQMQMTFFENEMLEESLKINDALCLKIKSMEK